MKDLTSARKYGKALFDLSVEKKCIDAVSEGIKVLKRSYKEIPEFRAFLYSFHLETGDKIKAIRNIFGDAVPDLLANFIRTLIDNKKQDLLLDISDIFDRMALESKNKILVKAITSDDMSDELHKKIKAALDRSLGKDVTIDPNTDPSILGGIILRVGNTVIDGSIKGRLTRLRADLLN